jgi:Lon protease-like protein
VSAPPLDLAQILAEFSGRVRLCPLPSVVLFPDTLVPLKIFEPRYAALVEEALRDDGLIAMALLRPGWEEDYEGSPAIFPVVCVGKVLSHRRLPDEKFDLVLCGLVRARILEEEPAAPFRRARVEILEERAPAADARAIAQRMRRALDLVPGLQPLVWELRRMANQLRGVDASAGRYADAVANASDLPAQARYEVLAESDVLARFDRLIGYLEQRAVEGAPPGPAPADPRRN